MGRQVQIVRSVVSRTSQTELRDSEKGVCDEQVATMLNPAKQINWKTRENAIVEYLDYQIPVTQLKGPKGNGDMQAAKRDLNAPPPGGRQI